MTSNTQIKQYYRQKFPHIQRIGDTFFVTFRLYGSVPMSKINECKKRYHEKLNELKTSYSDEVLHYAKVDLHRNYIEEVHEIMHAIKSGPKYLGDIRCAQICKEQFHRFNNQLYKLISFTIMNNHVHLLIDTSKQIEILNYDHTLVEAEFQSLDRILKRIKGATARYCNKVLGRKGQFWERESYDTYIRNEKMLKRVITYILENPVKVGIVKDWRQYKWNYLDSSYEDH